MFRIRLDRRLAVDSTLFGVLLTLFVAAADLFGLLSPLELWLYDQRALRCQHWTPAPTDKLVHVDIDDAAMNSIGRWPWHRSVLVEVLDEIHLAGAKAVALDLLLSEPEVPEWRPLPDQSDPPQKFEHIDHDARLAEAMRRDGPVIVAARLPFMREKVTDVYGAMRQTLTARPTLKEVDLVAALRLRGFNGADLPSKVHADFHTARRAALFDRIKSEPETATREQLLSGVLPRVDTTLDSPLLNAFKGEYERVKAVRQFRRFALPPAATAGAPLFDSSISEAPVEPLGAAASAGGFVDYLQSADGRVRAVPLFIESDGLVYPQFGVALACQFLGADPGKIRLTERTAIIPRPGGDLIVPVRTFDSDDAFNVEAGRDIPMVAGVSWFGGREWVKMYDRSAAEDKSQHLSIARVWGAYLARRKLVKSNGIATWAIRLVGSPRQLREFEEDAALGRSDHALKVIDAVLKDAEFKSQDLEATRPEDRDESDRFFLKALNDLRNVRELYADLDAARSGLRSAINGRAVLVGWIATASIADFLPTSLHPSCPGVVLHGVIFNQIVNGEVWRTLPAWVTLLATVVVGLLVTAAVSLLTPAKALMSAAVLAAAFLLVNGFLLFDRFNLILGAAGPLVAIGAVWSGGTLAKLVLERWERARITRRFRSYVDPKVVSFVEKHPEMVRFEGQVRECTVVFTDVAGFTQLTEKYGAETVVMLNELWGVMIPVIRQNGGTFNKFLGDGVMFFFNAPELNSRHAHDAVATVLEMGKALTRYNAEVATPRGWPAIRLRWGVSTGNMVVGDAGSAGTEEPAADYTVLGDHVNLGSRLESASKAVGTTVLMTARTVELSGNGFLMRPVGKLCVVGKQSSVMTYEVLARLDEATDAQKSLAADTKSMVDSFLDGRLKECMEAIVRLESAHGRGKLTDLYRERCEYFMRDPSPGPFDCQIVLTEK